MPVDIPLFTGKNIWQLICHSSLGGHLPVDILFFIRRNICQLISHSSLGRTFGRNGDDILASICAKAYQRNIPVSSYPTYSNYDGLAITILITSIRKYPSFVRLQIFIFPFVLLGILSDPTCILLLTSFKCIYLGFGIFSMEYQCTSDQQMCFICGPLRHHLTPSFFMFNKVCDYVRKDYFNAYLPYKNPIRKM